MSDGANPFSGLKLGSYGVIYADPPWRFRTWTETNQTKSPSQHYALMTAEALKALPVASLASPDCLLVMWALQPMLDQAIDLMRAWEFKFKTAGAWAKQSKTGRRWAFGTGYLLRCAAEFYVIGMPRRSVSATRAVERLLYHLRTLAPRMAPSFFVHVHRDS